MKIRIQTAQNVEIEYEVAGIGYRFQAALIDLAVFLGYYAFILIAILFFKVRIFDTYEWLIYILLAPPVPLLLYPLLCEIFLRGQTVGKRAMNLKVVTVEGGEPSIGAYIIRWLFWILEANPFTAITGLGAASIISIVSTEYGQRVGDLAAGTTVVKLEKSEAELTDYLVPQFKEDYKALIPEVTKLSARDISIVQKGYLAVRSGASHDLSSNIAYKIAETLNVSNERIGETTRFLERVLNDYAFLTRNGAEDPDDRMEDQGPTNDAPGLDPLAGY